MQPNESALTCEQGTLLLSDLGRKRGTIEESLRKLEALAARELKSPGSLTNMDEVDVLLGTIEGAFGHFGATLKDLLQVDRPRYHIPMYRRTPFLVAFNRWNEDDQTKAVITAFQKQELRLTIEQRKEIANKAHDAYIAARNYCTVLSGALELAIHKFDRSIRELFSPAAMNIKRLPVALAFMLAKLSRVENPWQYLGMGEDEYRAFANAKRLLLVDEGPGQFAFNSILIKIGKHDVTVVNSAAEALERIKNSSQFDAVLTKHAFNANQRRTVSKESQTALPAIACNFDRLEFDWHGAWAGKRLRRGSHSRGSGFASTDTSKGITRRCS